MDWRSLSTPSPTKPGFVGEMSVSRPDLIGGADNYQAE